MKPTTLAGLSGEFPGCICSGSSSRIQRLLSDTKPGRRSLCRDPSGSLHRMDPRPNALASFQIAVVGPGEVAGMPAGYVPRDHEIPDYRARLTGRYSTFTVVRCRRRYRAPPGPGFGTRSRLTAHSNYSRVGRLGLFQGPSRIGDHRDPVFLRRATAMDIDLPTGAFVRSATGNPVPHSSLQVISGGAGGSSRIVPCPLPLKPVFHPLSFFPAHPFPFRPSTGLP